MHERVEPSGSVPPIHDVWEHHFDDHRPRRLRHEGTAHNVRVAHLGPVPELPGTRLSLRLSEDGLSMTIERARPETLPKDPSRVAGALRRAAWALDQNLPHAPALFLDALRTERLHLVASTPTAVSPTSLLRAEWEPAPPDVAPAGAEPRSSGEPPAARIVHEPAVRVLPSGTSSR